MGGGEGGATYLTLDLIFGYDDLMGHIIRKKISNFFFFQNCTPQGGYKSEKIAIFCYFPKWDSFSLDWNVVKNGSFVQFVVLNTFLIACRLL